MNRQKLQRVAITSASSILAVVVALVICAILLLVTGKDPRAAVHDLVTAGAHPAVRHGRG